MLKLTIAQLLLLSQGSQAVNLSSEEISAFSLKDLQGGLMHALNLDQRESVPQQSLAQGKKRKHRKPAVALYLQEGEMEGFMDDFIEKEEKAPTPEATQASQALAAGKSEVQAGGQDNYVMTTIDLKNIKNEQYVGTLMFGSNKQKMPILFDTGSSLMYVVSDKCDQQLCP